MRFATGYNLPDGYYETTLYARDQNHTLELLKQRGLGEHLLQPYSGITLFPSDLILLSCWNDAIHSACWLGMIACSAGVTTGFDLLQDQGLIHLISHLARQNPEVFKPENLTDKMRWMMQAAFDAAKALEERTPGFQRFEGDEIPT